MLREEETKLLKPEGKGRRSELLFALVICHLTASLISPGPS